MAEDMEMLKLLQASAGAQQPQQGMMPEQMMQQQQQPQAQQIRNPIESGSQAAIAATKRSLEMSDSENNRALGRAIIQMMSNVYKQPSWGTSRAGNIGALGASFGSGLEAYDRERDRIAHINHMLQVEQKREEALAKREEREMKKMEHDMKMAQQNLAINQGYFGLKKSEMEHEKQLAEEMTKAGASIPLGQLAMHPSMHNKAMDNIKSYIDKGDAAIPALQAIDTIENILTRDPDVTKHWGIIALAAQRNDPGYVHQKLANTVPEKTRIHAELLSKSLSNLATQKFKGIPARGLTVFAEKMLKEGSPSMDMNAKTILKMVPMDKKYFKHAVEARDLVYENLQKGIAHTPKPMELELEKWEEDEAENPYLGLSDSELAAKEAEIRKQLGGS